MVDRSVQYTKSVRTENIMKTTSSYLRLLIVLGSMLAYFPRTSGQISSLELLRPHYRKLRNGLFSFIGRTDTDWAYEWNRKRGVCARVFSIHFWYFGLSYKLRVNLNFKRIPTNRACVCCIETLALLISILYVVCLYRKCKLRFRRTSHSFVIHRDPVPGAPVSRGPFIGCVPVTLISSERSAIRWRPAMGHWPPISCRWWSRTRAYRGRLAGKRIGESTWRCPTCWKCSIPSSTDTRWTTVIRCSTQRSRYLLFIYFNYIWTHIKYIAKHIFHGYVIQNVYRTR